MARPFKRTSLLFLAIAMLIFGISQQAAAQTSDNEVVTSTEAPQLSPASNEDFEHIISTRQEPGMTNTLGLIASNEVQAITADNSPTAVTVDRGGTGSGQSPLQIILIAGALLATVLVLLVTLRDQDMM